MSVEETEIHLKISTPYIFFVTIRVERHRKVAHRKNTFAVYLYDNVPPAKSEDHGIMAV